MKLLDTARRRSGGVFLLVGVLAVAGALAFRTLPSSIFPEVTFPIVKVIADVGEQPAATMMPTATRPLEEAILRVPGIRQVRSITSRGSSELTANFAWGTDMVVAVQRVQAEVQRISPDLPPNTRVDVEWMNPAIFPIQGYALTSDVETQAQLWQLAEYTLKPALIRIPGISQVQIQGGRQREFQVVLDPAALQGHRLAPADVVDALRRNNAIRSAGFTEANHELYLTLVDGRVNTVDQLGQMAVTVPGAPPVTLGQLGTVRVADQVSYIRTTANGRPAVLVNIVRQPGANTVAIADGVRQLFRDRPDLLPRDVHWTNFYDQGAFVAASLAGARDAILIGVVLAGVVLLVFLRKWRLTIVAVITIPITVAIVILALTLLGQTVNLMTLAGVAASLGLIADDAIVVIENIEHQEASGHPDPAVHGVRQIVSALVNSSLSTIVILIPFALLTGVVGAFFKPLALTMALALVISFFVALLVVPVAISLVAPSPAGVTRRDTPPARGASPMGARLRALGARGDRWYARVSELFIARGIAAVALAAALIGGAYFLYGRMGTDFLPKMDEGSIILDYWTPPGTSLSETDAMLRHAENVIMAIPDVQSYSRRTGTQLGFFVTEPNRGDYVIKLKPPGQRRSVDEVINTLRDRIAAVEPAIHTDFGQLLEDNIGDLTGGAPQPIDIKIFGDDQALLQRTANRVATAIASVPGVSDVFNGITIAGPALDFRVDPAAAARYGLTTESIQAALEPAVIGTVANQIFVGDRLYDLRVFAPAGTSLPDLKIRSPTAGLIPLSAVATLRTGAPETEIDRENIKSFLGVTARLSGRDLGGAMADIGRTISTRVPLPPGMHITYGGQFEQQQQSFRSLLYVLLSGLLLVAVIVLFEFGDWRAPVVTAICAIAVLSGVLAALQLTGMTLNISSYVGAIMMVGIVGENAIFVIHEAQLALASGTPPREAWMHASRRRLRPVAMTILATALALAPLALAIGQGSQLIQPLAVAVIGGFVLSGPIVLFLLPGLYRLLDPHGRLGSALTPRAAS